MFKEKKLNIMKALIISRSRVLAGGIILMAIFLISNSCSKSSNSSATPGANEVLIQNNAFDPATITVSAGTTVTWTNKDAVSHTVTSNTGGELNSGTLGTNGVYTHMFATAGSYPYHCVVHPSMTATVIVN
jgi:plastocyanin